ncbi:hypothetical protein BJ878DRAFT_147787 [Calycina marina]|uniref:Uncharacterized protein n=1 Tax=Calycina marina TaxID=1763456 RepID=A0A9P8CDL6_9HELO|nr:hypothetical protein BJ878DRAFT_147787 [Calycina marina]
MFASQSRYASTYSSGRSYQGKDYLTTRIPAEVMLEIISNVPSTDYNNIYNSAKHLRNFLQSHACRVCNRRIEKFYLFESTLLFSVEEKGWLVPRYSQLKLRVEVRIDFDRQNEAFGPFQPDFRITRPGPNFLLFLDVKRVKATRVNPVWLEKGVPLRTDEIKDLDAYCLSRYQTFLQDIPYFMVRKSDSENYVELRNWYFGPFGVIHPNDTNLQGQGTEGRDLVDEVYEDLSAGVGSLRMSSPNGGPLAVSSVVSGGDA